MGRPSRFPHHGGAGEPVRATVGDTLVFYGLGFGQTTPPVTEGVAVPGAPTVANCVMVFETSGAAGCGEM